MIKKYSLLLLLLIAGVNSYAGHLLGGEFTYRCLGNNDYEINLTIYRNCVCEPGSPQCADFDEAAKITIFNNEQAIDTVLLNLDVDANRDVICSSMVSNICVERSTGYSAVITLPPSADNYDLVYTRCCRNENITNIANEDIAGSTYIITIPNMEIAACNSSPTFKTNPQISLRAGFPFTHDHSATDEDGDSLVYQLCTPLDYPLSPDNSVYGPTIRPGDFAPAPPYNEIKWASNYNELNTFGGDSAIQIDAVTGLLQAMPTTRGEFVVGVCVLEFRNDTLLSTVMRDFQYNVVDEINNCNCGYDMLMIWCQDNNNNGLGNPQQNVKSCEKPEGYVLDCSDEEEIVSINENSDRVVSIYPNPSKGIFKIELASTQLNNSYFSSYNSSGQLVIKPTILPKGMSWQSEDKLSNGIYYVQLQLNGKFVQQKLMVIQ